MSCPNASILPFALFLLCLTCLDVCAAGECEVLQETGIPKHCPGPGDNASLTECCYSNDGVHCCVQSDLLNQQVVMIVALSVIITCIALTIIIVVCCFCPRCLLYDTCRANYTHTHGEIITYTKEEEIALNCSMPAEDHNGKGFYSPHAVRIKPIADV